VEQPAGERRDGGAVIRPNTAEAGVALVEVLVVVAILMSGALCALALAGGGHAGTRPAALVQLAGAIDRAHNLAAANGAALVVAPALDGAGSDITIYDAFAGGNVVATMTTPEPIGASCTGPLCAGGRVSTAFTLRVRRDGSFDGDSGAGLVGALTLTIGIVDGGRIREAFTLDTTDFHAPLAADS
jgi:hypothetical protein